VLTCARVYAGTRAHTCGIVGRMEGEGEGEGEGEAEAYKTRGTLLVFYALPMVRFYLSPVFLRCICEGRKK
jgi:hypothetical protein